MNSKDKTDRPLTEESVRVRSRAGEAFNPQPSLGKAELIASDPGNGYRAIFDTANDAIFVHDIDTGAILDVNQKMCEMYGYTREEVLRLTVEDLSAAKPPYTQKNALRKIRKAAHGEPQLFEWTAKSKSGRLFWVEVSLKRTIIQGNDRLLAIVRDITERKQAEEALRETKDRLEVRVKERTEELRKKNEELETLVYSVSHDLQTPLRAILGHCQTLMDNLAERVSGEHLETVLAIGKAADNMNRLIGDMLTYARLGIHSISKVEVSLTSILNYCQFELIEEFKKSGADIRVPDLLPVIKGDERMLVRLMANLLSNAIKFVPAERNPQVDIEAAHLEGLVRVSVRDNGIGIPAESTERIFRMFERLHSQDKYPGTGVGLAIAKKIVDLHGGKIGVISEPGKGSTFWFEIPD